MNKFLSSKLFVILTPTLTFIIGLVAGWLLGYQPNVSGNTNGYVGMYGGNVSGSTSTTYVFQIKTSVGYWLFALVISLVVLLLCVLIKKQFSEHK